MHPRSPYTAYLDFRKLAKDCPGFAPYVDANSNVEFKDPSAVRELAKSLLSRDFGLAVELPENRLCPMIPNRLDYILWIQDLLDTTSGGLPHEADPSAPATGLDVGTGASCIYPLLACSLRPSWRMIATDIDRDTLQCAAQNIARNELKLGGRIRLHESPVDGPLFPLDVLEIDTIDFTMCNPPFYESAASLAHSATFKSLPPSSACTGTPTEMVYAPTGELGFARRMLQESLVLRTRVRWYSTLFGKLSSVSAFVDELRDCPPAGNWAVTEMVQGTTKRWAVAWSFGDMRPAAGVAGVAGGGSALKGCSPPVRSELEFGVARAPDAVAAQVAALLAALELATLRCVDGTFFHGEAAGNVWSRAARRAKSRGEGGGADGRGGPVMLGFVVTISADGARATRVEVAWRRGRDGVLFESFCGMLKRKLQVEVQE